MSRQCRFGRVLSFDDRVQPDIAVDKRSVITVGHRYPRASAGRIRGLESVMPAIDPTGTLCEELHLSRSALEFDRETDCVKTLEARYIRF